MRYYLVRHGQSEGNINRAVYFEKMDCDVELTEQGKADAVKAGDRIMDLNDHFVRKNDPDYLYPTKNPPYRFNMVCSPYLRAKQTANIIHGRITSFDGYYIDNFQEMPLLVERNWGSLRDIVEAGNKTEDHFNFFYRPTDGESFLDTYQRVAIFDMWLMANSKWENNIIVAHGEFNKVYLMYLLGWGVEEFNKWKTPRNGEVYVIDRYDVYNSLSSLTPLTEKHIKH
jgi:broad specificity phosphatase PhoE